MATRSSNIRFCRVAVLCGSREVCDTCSCGSDPSVERPFRLLPAILLFRADIRYARTVEFYL